MALVIVAGASGRHAIVVYEACLLAGVAVAGIASYDENAPGEFPGGTYLGPIDALLAGSDVATHSFVVACGANRDRANVVTRLLERGGTLASVIHPAATISPSATIEPGAMILAGAIIGPFARIGRSTIINHAASVDHDCHVGPFSNVCPGARLAGAVRLGEGVFVGLNASVLPGLRVEAWSTIGAGAVVVRNVVPASTMVGVPARPVSRSSHED